jgi:uncharacterized membrane protein
MKQVKNNIRVDASAARIFQYLTQPANLPDIWPSMTAVSNVVRSPDGSHSFDWVYKMAGMHFDGHSDSVRIEKDHLIETHTTKGIKNTFRWTFAGRGDTTDVTLEVEYELPIPLLGKLAESFLVKANERESATLLRNLKAHLEAPIPRLDASAVA